MLNATQQISQPSGLSRSDLPRTKGNRNRRIALEKPTASEATTPPRPSKPCSPSQLSEIAILALSPAVNDTYTGLICIDWLGDALRMMVALPMPDEAWPTRRGEIRLLFPPVERIVPTAFDLIRHAGASNPAVIIRLLQTSAGSPRCCERRSAWGASRLAETSGCGN